MNQHDRNQKLVLDILENAISVLRREREIHGRPLNDVIINLETASVILTELRDERSPFESDEDRIAASARKLARDELRSPFDTLRESPFEATR